MGNGKLGNDNPGNGNLGNRKLSIAYCVSTMHIMLLIVTVVSQNDLIQKCCMLTKVLINITQLC